MNIRKWLQSATLGILALLTSLFLGEAVIGFFNSRSGHEKFQKLDKELDDRNRRFAAMNPYGFTDVVREKAREPGVFRIAVLGDSVVWGNGLPFEESWSHKLEGIMQKRFTNVEVLSWGRNGWSTKDELRFLRMEGYEFELDLLIVGLIHNDVDVGDLRKLNRGARLTSLSEKLGVFATLFPRVTKRIVKQYLNIRYDTANRYYRHWINELYEPANLRKYQDVLNELAHYCDSLNLPLLMVFTPHNLHGENRPTFIEDLVPMLEEAGIEHLNLLPEAERRFREYPTSILSANPANNHPGSIMTQFFAEEVFDYLSRASVSRSWTSRDIERAL